MKNKVNFISFFDENLVEPFIVNFTSIKNNFNSEFIYYIGISKKAEILLKDFLIENTNIEYKVVDVGFEVFENSLPTHITNFSYFRFYIFDIFDDIKKDVPLIWSDPDIIFEDIPNDYIGIDYPNIAFSNNEKGNIEISKKGWYIVLKNTKYLEVIQKKIIDLDYFNAGILIINDFDKIEDLFKLCIKSGFDIDDQTLLNYFNDGHISISRNTKWNCQIKHSDVARPKIVHYSGNNKPWNYSEEEALTINKEFGRYFKYKRIASSWGFIKNNNNNNNNNNSKLVFVVTNHEKGNKFTRNILNFYKRIKELYSDYIDVLFTSSSHSEEEEKYILNSGIKFIKTSNDTKKFGKLKELYKSELINSNDYVQILDADDIIITELLPQIINVIKNTYSDIIRNTTLKIDPTLYGNEIYHANEWSGISSNTLFRWGILNNYFMHNDYDEILSEDNVRYLYVLLKKQKVKVQIVNIPYYLGVRWWNEEAVSHSSIVNNKSDYINSKRLLELLKVNIVKINLFFEENYFNNEMFLLRRNNILISWNQSNNYIKKEASLKIKRIFYEHIREGIKDGVSLTIIKEEIYDLMSKFNFAKEYNINEILIIRYINDIKELLLKSNSFNDDKFRIFTLKIPGGILEFDSKHLKYEFKKRGDK